MKKKRRKGEMTQVVLLFLLLCVAFTEINANGGIVNNGVTTSYPKILEDGECAVVTLLYQGHVKEHGFVQCAQTLGFSLRDSHSRMKMIAMITPNVPDSDRALLAYAGWEIMVASPIANPNSAYNPHFDLTYTKLQIFNMTAYKKVVFLDADTQVTENIDILCSCNAPYSAVVRNILTNNGVMVIEPNEATFVRLMESVPGTFSYDGADQGFFNSYFWNMERCLYYDPALDLNKHGIAPRAPCYRLPGHYNGDIGLYVARNYWLLSASMQRTLPAIIHYTMGPFKPYNWMSYAVVDHFYTWWDVYNANREIGYADSVYFLAAPFFLVMFWVLLARNDFVIPIFSKALVTRCMTVDLFKSNTIKLMISYGVHLIAISGALAVSSMVFIDPLVNATIFVVTYCTLYEILCIHFTNYILMSIILNDPTSHEYLSNLNVSVTLHLPDTTKFYRVIVYGSTSALMLVLMCTSITIYARGVLVAVWAFFVMGIVHTTFIIHNYARDVPLKITP